MIFDRMTLFSNAQNLAQVAGTYASTNVIDSVAADPGAGETAYVAVMVDEAFAGSGATVQVKLQTSSDALTWSDLTTSKAFAIAELGRGMLFAAPLPLGCQRYVRLAYVVAGATTTVGKVTAGLVLDVDSQRTYPVGWAY